MKLMLYRTLCYVVAVEVALLLDCTVMKQKFKNAKIYSVEPENFDDTKKSLEKSSIISNSMKHKSICDALLAEKPGKITFEINRLNLTFWNISYR